MLKTIGIRIETSMVAGSYQHKVYDIGVNEGNRQKDALPEAVVEALIKANEAAHSAMPEGSLGLVSIIKYSLPKG